MPEIVAQRVKEHGLRRHRTLDERALILAPRLYVAAARVFGRLRPRSRLRQVLLRHQMLSGWAASSRTDFDLMQVRYARGVVYEYNPELVTLGLPARIEGRDPWIASLLEFRTAWTEWRFTLVFILDLGERFITLGHGSWQGRASGIQLEREFCQVIEVSNGIVTRERDFTEWSQGLVAAGLDPGILMRLRKLPPGGAAELVGAGPDDRQGSDPA